ARIGIAAGELHRRDVTAAELAILVDHSGRNVHTVLAAGRLEVARGAGVPEATAAEMHTDPDEAVLVAPQVGIVGAPAPRAELACCLLTIGLHVGLAPCVGVVEQCVLDTLVVAAAEPERDGLRDVLDDRSNAIGYGRKRHVEPHGHVAATDIEANAGDADLLLVSDYAADRLGIAEMSIGADDAGDGVADAHAIAHLRQRRLVMLTEHRERAVLKFGPLRLQRSDTGRGRRGLLQQMFLPGRIAIGAPSRHRAHARPFAAAVGIDPSRTAKLAGAFLIRVGAAHG